MRLVRMISIFSCFIFACPCLEDARPSVPMRCLTERPISSCTRLESPEPMSTQGEKSAPDSSSAMTSSDDISLGKPEDLGQAPSQPHAQPSDPQHMPTTDSLDVRQSFGSITHAISEVINEHIIAARYATFATVILLGAYGAAKTPFFFRYKTVSEIPADCFAKRQTIHGRIVHIVDSGKNNMNYDSNVEKPVICLVRHLSPVGRLLSKSAFDFSLKNAPSVRLGGKIEDSRDLLKVEIGVYEFVWYTHQHSV